MTPYLADTDVTLYHGDCLDVLRELPSGSVHMCATSPPFYGLRDYGTEGQIGLEETPEQWVERLVAVFREVKRVLRDDGVLFVEIGDSYVSGSRGKITEHDLRDVRESSGEAPREGQVSAVLPEGVQAVVLRDPGEPRQTVGEVAGVSRSASGTTPSADAPAEARDPGAGDGDAGREVRLLRRNGPGVLDARSRPERREQGSQVGTASPDAADHPGGVPEGSLPSALLELQLGQAFRGRLPAYEKLAPKNLLGQPWRLAFALQDDGWILRSEIIWARTNPMPESVTDRPTKSHSTVFLLSKRPRYFYDADAIREEEKPWNNGRAARTARSGDIDNNARPADIVNYYDEVKGANARSVWTIPTEPTPFAHFATWPRKLVARMIQAGTSERGCCPECGAPWVRDTLVELTEGGNGGPGGVGRRLDGTRDAMPRMTKTTQTLGWSPSCTHDYAPVPCTVLDPFAGSGTTNLVARNHGRHSIGIELNAEYLKIAADRLSQLSLLA